MSLNDENPTEIFNNIKKLLINGAKDRNHSYHTPVFSNKSQDNSANSRIVVLRKFNEKELYLNFHTDFRSPKVNDLKINNQSLFVFYDKETKIQLRIKTESYINNNNLISENAWLETRIFSRKCYLTTKAPSSVTLLPEDGIPTHLKGNNPSTQESEEGYKNFTVVKSKIKNIDWLHLSSSGHRRLLITINNNLPQFKWLIP